MHTQYMNHALKWSICNDMPNNYKIPPLCMIKNHMDQSPHNPQYNIVFNAGQPIKVNSMYV